MGTTEPDGIVDRIRIEIRETIPKPKAMPYRVKGWGRRRGEPALVYFIPNRKDPKRPYEKGISESEFVSVHNRINEAGEFRRDWFENNLQACAGEGPCNFTTIGGVFERLGKAAYAGQGVYRAK